MSLRHTLRKSIETVAERRQIVLVAEVERYDRLAATCDVVLPGTAHGGLTRLRGVMVPPSPVGKTPDIEPGMWVVIAMQSQGSKLAFVVSVIRNPDEPTNQVQPSAESSQSKTGIPMGSLVPPSP